MNRIEHGVPAYGMPHFFPKPLTVDPQQSFTLPSTQV